MAPGPGRSSDASINPAGVPSMQNTEASVAFAGMLVLMGPAAAPFSLIVRQAGLPKQPGFVASWPGQNWPVAFVALAVPVVSGERLTPIGPTCAPSQQLPPVTVQGQLQLRSG